jgi:regulator of nonsense transcripts 2
MQVLKSPVKAVRPKLELAKTLEEAANAVDDMFNSAFQTAGKKNCRLKPEFLI